MMGLNLECRCCYPQMKKSKRSLRLTRKAIKMAANYNCRMGLFTLTQCSASTVRGKVNLVLELTKKINNLCLHQCRLNSNIC
jgi:hypothetical protein